MSDTLKKDNHSKTLFKNVDDSLRLNKEFNEFRERSSSLPARWMADHVYQLFKDPEGNFLEQFQTNGFSPRLFELYLFAYFYYEDFHVDRDHVNPDFLVSRNGLTVAVEATTINPSTSGVLSISGKEISDLSDKEFEYYRNHELPIRFGSPLFSKLKKKYWELEHCKGLPFVIAIEAFYDEGSLAFSESALASYLYGLDEKLSWDNEGNPHVQRIQIDYHQVDKKRIQSNFFSQPDAINISAIVFTNSGTFAKFARMGYQYGIGANNVYIIRTGHKYNSNALSFDPTLFSFSMDNAPFIESWGDDLVVLHNPKCLHSIPRGYFPDAVDLYLENGILAASVPGWHTISSKTLIMHLDEKLIKLKKTLPFSKNRWSISAISAQEFREISGTPSPPEILGQEHGWFCDDAGGFFGVILQDHIDSDWGYAILARGENFAFHAIDLSFGFVSRDRAIIALHFKLLERLLSPKRIFVQDEV